MLILGYVKARRDSRGLSPLQELQKITHLIFLLKNSGDWEDLLSEIKTSY